MGFLIIGVIIGIVFVILDYGLEWYSKIFYVLLMSIAGFLIGLLFWVFIGSAIGMFLPTVESISEVPIYALNDGSHTTGYYCLTGGQIDGKEVIKYIADGEYGKKIYTSDAKNSYINEGYEDAKVEIRNKHFKHDWFFWFALNFSESVYIFYVPDGSVTNEINIDLE